MTPRGLMDDAQRDALRALLERIVLAHPAVVMTPVERERIADLQQRLLPVTELEVEAVRRIAARIRTQTERTTDGD